MRFIDRRVEIAFEFDRVAHDIEEQPPIRAALGRSPRRPRPSARPGFPYR